MNIEAKAINLLPLSTANENASPFMTAQAALPFLGRLKVRLTARIGCADMTIGELTALKEGAVLALDKLIDQPVDLLAEGHLIAQGTLVAVDDHFGVRVTAVAQVS
jgi:flagellar motor switch protein FliN/FliY